MSDESLFTPGEVAGSRADKREKRLGEEIDAELGRDLPGGARPKSKAKRPRLDEEADKGRGSSSLGFMVHPTSEEDDDDADGAGGPGAAGGGAEKKNKKKSKSSKKTTKKKKKDSKKKSKAKKGKKDKKKKKKGFFFLFELVQRQ